MNASLRESNMLSKNYSSTGISKSNVLFSVLRLIIVQTQKTETSHINITFDSMTVFSFFSPYSFFVMIYLIRKYPVIWRSSATRNSQRWSFVRSFDLLRIFLYKEISKVTAPKSALCDPSTLTYGK